MAKIDKNKPDIPDDGQSNRKDTEALMEIANEYVKGRYDEDNFIGLMDSVLTKLKKNKKYKEKKNKAKEVQITVSNTVTDFQLSYLRQIAKQIDKDLQIQVYTNF